MHFVDIYMTRPIIEKSQISLLVHVNFKSSFLFHRHRWLTHHTCRVSWKYHFNFFFKSFPRNICNIHFVPVFSRIFVIVSMLFQRLRLYFLHLTKTRTATWLLKKLQLYCSQGSSVQMYPTMLYKRSCGKSKKGVSRGTGKSSQNTFWVAILINLLGKDTKKQQYWFIPVKNEQKVTACRSATRSHRKSWVIKNSPREWHFSRYFWRKVSFIVYRSY